MDKIITTIEGLNKKILTTAKGNKYMLVQIEPEYVVALDMQRGNKFITGWCGTLNDDEDKENFEFLSEYENKVNKEEKEIIDYKSRVEALEKANEMLRKVIFQLTSSREQQDVKVSRRDFLIIYQNALDEMFHLGEIGTDFTPDNNAIYGHNVTVHWHGIYCDCGDGAIPANNIIDAVIDCDEELDGEEW